MKKLTIITISTLLILTTAFFTIRYFKNSTSTNEVKNTTTNNPSSKTNNTEVFYDTSKIEQVEISASRDGKKIHGILTAPKGYEKGELPTIIYSHGFNNTNSYGNFFAENLAKEGYAVYSFDFINGSNTGKSGNNMLEMSVFTEQEDLKAVFEMIKSQSFVKKENIYLMGVSQGGVVSTITALDLQKDIKGLILLYPAFVLFDDAREIFTSKDSIPEIYNHRGSNLGKVYFENLLDYDIYQKMPNLTTPVLIVHGTNDDVVPLSYSERAVKTLPNAKLKIIQGATHIFSRQNNQEALPSITEFLKENK